MGYLRHVGYEAFMQELSTGKRYPFACETIKDLEKWVSCIANNSGAQVRVLKHFRLQSLTKDGGSEAGQLVRCVRSLLNMNE